MRSLRLLNHFPKHIRYAKNTRHSSSLILRAGLPERMFSKVERTRTAVRSTMTEDRLESLVLLQAHRDDLPDTDNVIEKNCSH